MKNGLKIQVNCGNSSPIVLINLNKVVLTKDIVTFLSFYHFSKFKRGKYFLKRLLNRIFSKQLNENMLWDSNFWDIIQIDKMEAKIKYNNPDTSEIILDYLNISQSRRRIDNIMNYKSLLDDGVDLGHPLYITRDCLNTLGYISKKSDDLFIVDGARRFWANLLNEKGSMHIWLISLK